MKLKWVIAEPVATTLAPLTIRPLSVSFSTWTKTSLTSSAGRLRSTGGWMIAWFQKSTFSWDSRYQRWAFSW